MTRWKRYLIIFVVFVFMMLGAQAVMATETGTTADGFKWKYEKGVMEITGYEGDERTISIPSKINGHVVEKLHEDCFRRQSNITAVTIPNTVKEIGLDAFWDCWSLEHIKIPKSVNSIRHGAFWCCSSLKSIEIPGKVERIENYVFADCTSLEHVMLSNSVKYIYSNAFEGCTSLKEITLPDSVSAILEEAFVGCTNLTRLTIPDSVTSIGKRAFKGCAKLKSVTIPKSVTGIQSYAFGYISKHKKVSGFTIYGYYGSDAEEYAKKRSFNFVGKGMRFSTAPTSVKVKAGKRKATVSWKKLSKKQKMQVKSIQVQYSTDKTFFANAKIKNVRKTKTSVTLKLKYRDYYIRVRFVGEDGVSKWSKVRKVRTK